VTVQNLEIVATDGERGLIMVKGGLPGAKGGYVLVKDAVKRVAPEGLPFPAAIKMAAATEEAPAETVAETTEE
jgi:large subunit ribosomal protein L3